MGHYFLDIQYINTYLGMANFTRFQTLRMGTHVSLQLIDTRKLFITMITGVDGKEGMEVAVMLLHVADNSVTLGTLSPWFDAMYASRMSEK